MRHAVRFLLALAALVAVNGIALRLGANATAAGFAFLITVLVIAVATRLATALAASLLAALLYNYFFFPPLGTFSIHDSANWVALVSFFIASLVATRLVLRARQQAEAAEARRRDLETLYKLSVDLFAATSHVAAIGEAATQALMSFGATSGGLVLFDTDTGAPDVASWIGPADAQADARIARVARHYRPLEFTAAAGCDVYLPLHVTGHVAGVLCARETPAPVRALEAVATLVALAIERERLLAQTARVQALQEGDALKTSLLRAVSHDLATPLTAMTMQIDRLRALADEPRLREVVEDIAEHTGRLRRRIENLLAMARLEAHTVSARPEPTPAADLFRSVREHVALATHRREIEVSVGADCPDVYVNPSLALEILANLVENAHQASPADAPIQLSAHRHPDDPLRVRLDVADFGPGLHGQSSAASDTPRRGLGLEIARSLAGASGGVVTLSNRPGGGAIARVELPAAQLPMVEDAAV